MELRSDAQLRLSADRVASGEVKINAGAAITMAPSAASAGVDPASQIVVQSTALENSAVASTSATRGNHAYATDAVTIRGKKSTAASTGGNLASSAEADIGSALTGSYQIGFNIKAGAAALTVFRFCDSSLSLASGIRLAVTSSGWKNRILFRRLKYSADNSTFQMFANGVPVALNMSGYTAATAFAADIPSPAKVYFGGAF
eukprot:jgi/Mesvir1/101/Mv02492-RA.1